MFFNIPLYPTMGIKNHEVSVKQTSYDIFLFKELNDLLYHFSYDVYLYDLIRYFV